MTLLYPEVLFLGLVVLLFFSRKAFREFTWRFYNYTAIFLLLVFALSRPVIEQKPITQELFFHDVVLGVDFSYSMQAEDILPSRLVKSKEYLLALVDDNKQTKFAVFGFTSNAIVLSPLTQDRELLRHLFLSLDETKVMTKSTAIMPSLELARKMSKAKRLSVVLFTDGGDAREYSKEAYFAKEHNLIVNIMMLATKTGSTLSLGDKKFLKDQEGNIVLSRENSAIEVLAQSSGGVYTHDFDVLQKALESQREELYGAFSDIVSYEELFYYPLSLALVLFMLGVTTLGKYFFKGALFVLVFFGVNLGANPLDAFYAYKAKEAYGGEKFTASAHFYEKLQTPHAMFNAANAYYKAGEYEKALNLYTNVKSSDAEFKAALFYNIANTYLRLKEFAKAKDFYKKSLTLSYSKEADENYMYIKDVAEEMRMQTGQQESKKRSANPNEQESSSPKNQKEGGGSNMKSDTTSQSGGGEMKKKTKSESIFSTAQSKAKLSSKQYELINQRGVNEDKPW